MTKCYDCEKWFDISPDQRFFLVGAGDFIVEEHNGVHFLVNIDNNRVEVIDERKYTND